MRTNLISVVLAVAMASVAFAGPAAAGEAPTARAGGAIQLASLPENLAPAQLLALPPSVQKAWVMRKAAQQRSRAQAAGLDTLGPTLSVFDAKPTVTAGNPLLVRVGLSDDLSGVKGFVAFGIGAAGRFTMSHELPAPVSRLNAWMSIDLSRDLPAGRYIFDFAYAYDEAGNVATFDRQALAAVGPSEVQVANPSRGDAQLPSVVSAKVLTPRVSLSGVHPGTDKPAYAKVSMSASDVGDLSRSGVYQLEASFCQNGNWPCIFFKGQTMAPGLASATLTLGVQPRVEGLPPGDYIACSLSAFDWAGQIVGYASTQCGGDTDFSLFFPGVSTITLTP